MEEYLKKASELIDKSTNIPDNIKPIVKTICRGYIRESNGKIPLEGIINVCNTTFIKIDENDKEFSGKNRYLGNTQTDYDENCNIIHKMSYVNSSNYIKLITILTHEIGHVITEYNPCKIDDEQKYPLAKRTTTIYTGMKYVNGELHANNWWGFRLADGFLESICTKIFSSKEYRQELLDIGYDLKDYKYKDKRLFPSRVYDEYKACFELFDYIMDGALFNFSCMRFNNNNDFVNYINEHKLINIFQYLDKSNEALWNLKEYENQEWNEDFNQKLEQYLEQKDHSLQLAHTLQELYGKSTDDKEFQRLYDIYANILNKQELLPIPEYYLKTNGKAKD